MMASMHVCSNNDENNGNSCNTNTLIDRSSTLLKQLSLLYLNERDSDLVFIVGDERIFAHKFVLILRCEYFRVMFSSGLREAIRSEVEVKETPLTAFKSVLYFMYTGLVHLADKKFDDIIDILCLGHRYEMHELVDNLTSYLERNITSENVCTITCAANLFSLRSLIARSQRFLLSHGYQVLEEDAFYNFCAKTIIKLFSSDEFCAEEINIFRAVIKYLKRNASVCDEEMRQKIIATVRLPLICWNDMVAYVWPSGLFGKEDLLERIENNTECNDNFDNNTRIAYRKCVAPINSLQSISHRILERNTLHRSPTDQTELTLNFSIPGCVTIKLDCTHFINYIGLVFGNCENSGYSFFVEVSVNNNQWHRIADFTDYFCHCAQHLYFTKTTVKYIRVYATRCFGGGTRFVVNSFRCCVRAIPSQLYHRNAKNKCDLDYRSMNHNKCYCPLYGPLINLNRSKSSSKLCIAQNTQMQY